MLGLMLRQISLNVFWRVCLALTQNSPLQQLVTPKLTLLMDTHQIFGGFAFSSERRNTGGALHKNKDFVRGFIFLVGHYSNFRLRRTFPSSTPHRMTFDCAQQSLRPTKQKKSAEPWGNFWRIPSCPLNACLWGPFEGGNWEEEGKVCLHQDWWF